MSSNTSRNNCDDDPSTPPYPCSSNNRAEEMGSNSASNSDDDLTCVRPSSPPHPCVSPDKKRAEEIRCNPPEYEWFPPISSGEKRRYEYKDVIWVKKIKSEPEPLMNPLHVNLRTLVDNCRDWFCWCCHVMTTEYDCPHCPRTYHISCFKKTQECDCQYTFVHVEKPNINYARDLNDLLQLCLQVIERDYTISEKYDHLLSCLIYLDHHLDDNNVYYPVSLTVIISRIQSGYYKNTNQFYIDVKWMTHNMYILLGGDHENTITTKKFEKDVKLQLCDLEACGECYKEKNKYDSEDDFFVKLCSTPHSIVWAKLKGYPFWPAKCLRIVNDYADVRFFGTHDKSFIPISSVYKISRQNPGGNPKKITTSYETSMSELHAYICNYEQVYGSFHFYDEKTPLQSASPGKESPQNKKKKQLVMSTNDDKNDGAGAIGGSAVIDGVGAIGGSAVIGIADSACQSSGRSIEQENVAYSVEDDVENRSPCGESNVNKNLNAHQSLDDDDDIEYLDDEDPNAKKDDLDDYDVLKSFMEVIFANKPGVRFCFKIFQQLILQLYLKMYMDIEEEKSNPSKRLNLRQHFTNVINELESRKAESEQLQLKVRELEKELEEAEKKITEMKNNLEEATEAAAQRIVETTLKINEIRRNDLTELTSREQKLIKELETVNEENKVLERELQQLQELNRKKDYI